MTNYQIGHFDKTDISIITNKEGVVESLEDDGPLTEHEVVEINDFKVFITC